MNLLARAGGTSLLRDTGTGEGRGLDNGVTGQVITVATDRRGDRGGDRAGRLPLLVLGSRDVLGRLVRVLGGLGEELDAVLGRDNTDGLLVGKTRGRVRPLAADVEGVAREGNTAGLTALDEVSRVGARNLPDEITIVSFWFFLFCISLCLCTLVNACRYWPWSSTFSCQTTVVNASRSSGQN